MDLYGVMKQAQRQKVSDNSEDAMLPKYQSSAEVGAKLKIGRQSLIQLSSEHVIGGPESKTRPIICQRPILYKMIFGNHIPRPRGFLHDPFLYSSEWHTLDFPRFRLRKDCIVSPS